MARPRPVVVVGHEMKMTLESGDMAAREYRSGRRALTRDATLRLLIRAFTAGRRASCLRWGQVRVVVTVRCRPIAFRGRCLAATRPEQPDHRLQRQGPLRSAGGALGR